MIEDFSKIEKEYKKILTSKLISENDIKYSITMCNLSKLYLHMVETPKEKNRLKYKKT